MIRRRTFLLTSGIAAAGYALARHLRPGLGHRVSGGILIGNAPMYDGATRLLFGSFYRGVADDVARVADPGSRILEVGCGPGHLAGELAKRGLIVTGLDLDPAMVERARANIRKRLGGLPRPPSYDVGDVASLPYPDHSFDLVVSTLSLHHWADPVAGLTDVARVLQPEGRALIWDLGSGAQLLHGQMPDPASHVDGSALRLVDVTPWRWPFGFTPTRRMELVPY